MIIVPACASYAKGASGFGSAVHTRSWLQPMGSGPTGSGVTVCVYVSYIGPHHENEECDMLFPTNVTTIPLPTHCNHRHRDIYKVLSHPISPSTRILDHIAHLAPPGTIHTTEKFRELGFRSVYDYIILSVCCACESTTETSFRRSASSPEACKWAD